ncbi:hypothetical protein B566_EDAN012992 [Ephemera danica]|nr:hypothetical protein B566_EDAN012992 [Ephemera danica]
MDFKHPAVKLLYTFYEPIDSVTSKTAEYVKSFREIKDKGDEEGTYYMILSNMVYVSGEVQGYDFFQCEDLAELNEAVLMKS